MPKTPKAGDRHPDRRENDAYWLVCEDAEDGMVTVQLIRAEGRPPGPELRWSVNRWQTFIERHVEIGVDDPADGPWGAWR